MAIPYGSFVNRVASYFISCWKNKKITIRVWKLNFSFLLINMYNLHFGTENEKLHENKS